MESDIILSTKGLVALAVFLGTAAALGLTALIGCLWRLEKLEAEKKGERE